MRVRSTESYAREIVPAFNAYLYFRVACGTSCTGACWSATSDGF